MVRMSTCPPYQPARATCRGENSSCVQTTTQGKDNSDNNRQHHGKILFVQTRQNTLEGSSVPLSANLGLVCTQPDKTSGHPPAGKRQFIGGCAEQDLLNHSRMATECHTVPAPGPALGLAGNRSVCITQEHPVPCLLCSPSPPRHPGVSGGRVSLHVVRRPAIRISATPADRQDSYESDPRQLGLHTCEPMVASSSVVCATVAGGQRGIPPTQTLAGSPDDSPRSSHSPGLRHTTPHGVEGQTSRGLSSPVRAILQVAQKSSTKKAYKYKWEMFTKFVEPMGLDPVSAPPPVLLDFLVHLARTGLSLTSLKCYVAALSWYRKGPSGQSCFQDPLVKLFFKGFKNLHPPVTPPPPAWSLELVLSQLSKPPFEPMASNDISHLSWKTAFLVAVTSARRASELCALRADPPYLRFHTDKVVLRTDITFLPKVVSKFHMCQDISLPAFFQNPASPLEIMLHSLDVRRALAYYVQRTAEYRKSPQLFLKYRMDKLGTPVSSQRLASWIVSTIRLAYRLADQDPPQRITAHSTRAMAASQAFLKGVPLEDICKAATWSSSLTFASHYKLDIMAKKDAAFGRAVLFSCVA
nr:PREDICTED: inositol hexakisphosphate kinase 3 isoform X1 [Anolis carolinensis]XP_008107944.1 PREDICTED: inositol hexakisphosphate kinase 3 isoform X1 [Anolis carolinensis]XP_016848789.1 PREDICTED: inositol hexakisphosphate kinase 3 isoform X1 [Anolis carolinensis]|eukprot:XP_008107943.1 PREDICTED: inositol hexakisphosphate kinase 3 isoform X1 [Anolis carolinensis]